MVKTLESQDVFAGGYYHACCRSSALNLFTTVTVQNLICSLLYGSIFLIDGGEKF